MSDGAIPLVSVGIPTYNRLPYLREAIASVREQTHPNWELFVVDDGSEDGTAEFVPGIRDDRVHLVRLFHSGNIARLRNRGVQEARGEYVAFLDSDASSVTASTSASISLQRTVVTLEIPDRGRTAPECVRSRRSAPGDLRAARRRIPLCSGPARGRPTTARKDTGSWHPLSPSI